MSNEKIRWPRQKEGTNNRALAELWSTTDDCGAPKRTLEENRRISICSFWSSIQEGKKSDRFGWAIEDCSITVCNPCKQPNEESAVDQEPNRSKMNDLSTSLQFRSTSSQKLICNLQDALYLSTGYYHIFLWPDQFLSSFSLVAKSLLRSKRRCIDFKNLLTYCVSRFLSWNRRIDVNRLETKNANYDPR